MQKAHPRCFHLAFQDLRVIRKFQSQKLQNRRRTYRRRNAVIAVFGDFLASAYDDERGRRGNVKGILSISTRSAHIHRVKFR